METGGRNGFKSAFLGGVRTTIIIISHDYHMTLHMDLPSVSLDSNIVLLSLSEYSMGGESSLLIVKLHNNIYNIHL